MNEALNDYELVYFAQEYNEDALELLYNKYTPLINKMSNSFYKKLPNKGLELKDIILECKIAFDESIYAYNDKKDSLFYTFTKNCMEKRLISIVRKEYSEKNQILNEAISLEREINPSESKLLENYIGSNKYNPEENLIKEETYQSSYQKATKELSNLEKKVLSLKEKNFNNKEIAMMLNKSEKSIYNTSQRIKRKIELLKQH